MLLCHWELDMQEKAEVALMPLGHTALPALSTLSLLALTPFSLLRTRDVQGLDVADAGLEEVDLVDDVVAVDGEGLGLDAAGVVEGGARLVDDALAGRVLELEGGGSRGNARDEEDLGEHGDVDRVDERE
jgi:hypothetical protein